MPSRLVGRTCRAEALQPLLDEYADTHEIVGMSSHHVGVGFGSYIELAVVFREIDWVNVEAGDAH